MNELDSGNWDRFGWEVRGPKQGGRAHLVSMIS